MTITPLRKALAGLALTAILAAAGLWLVPPAPAGVDGGSLVVANSDTGRSWRLSLDDVQRITFRFFHSYDRRWVDETFRVAGGRLVPVDVLYDEDSYDYRHERYQATARMEAHGVRLTDIRPAPSDRLENVIFRVAHVKSQVLVLHHTHSDEQHPFTQWGRPGQRLVISPR